MSNALAIGAVTAVIRSLLENGLIQQGIASSLGEVPRITAQAPELDAGSGGAQNRDRLNLFFCQATPNPGWRNVGMPTRNADGDRVNTDPLALDLHYILTAYSQETFHAEIMLGYAMQLLHETPVLPRDTIRSALRSLSGSNRPADRSIATADLADQIEQIKISAQPTNSEELSRFWSALQTPYRPSASYQVSVVLLEMNRSRKTALPVQQRNVYVTPFQQPIVESIESSDGATQPITLDTTLLIKGQKLAANTARIQIGNTSVPLLPQTINDRQITVSIANLAPSLRNALRSGIQTLQVIHDLMLGTPGDPHRGFESNITAFILRPQLLRNPDQTYQISLATTATGFTIRLSLRPIVGVDQRVLLLLNHIDATNAYSFEAIPRSQDEASVSFNLPRSIRSGRYLVRIQVDGAESLLDIDRDPTSATYLQFVGTPHVEVSS
jgi:Pvc16 N-terminal domain